VREAHQCVDGEDIFTQANINPKHVAVLGDNLLAVLNLDNACKLVLVYAAAEFSGKIQ
jgi:hypothetical protein